MGRRFVLSSFLILLTSIVMLAGCLEDGPRRMIQIENPRVGDQVQYSNGLTLRMMGHASSSGPDLLKSETIAFELKRGPEWGQEIVHIEPEGGYAVKESFLECYSRNSSDGQCDSRYGAVVFLNWGNPWLWGSSALFGRDLRDGDRIEAPVFSNQDYGGNWSIDFAENGLVATVEGASEQSKFGDFFYPARSLRFENRNPYPTVVMFHSGESVTLAGYQRGSGEIILSTFEEPEIRPAPEGAVLGRNDVFVGPPESGHSSFPLSEAIREARRGEPSIEELFANGELVWSRFAERPPPARVMLCPGSAGQFVPGEGANQTLETIHQWRIMLESTGDSIAFQVEKRTREALPAEYTVELKPPDSDALRPFEPPLDEPWLDLDWMTHYGSTIGRFDPSDATVGFGPGAHAGLSFFVSVTPSWGEAPECMPGGFAGGAYFVEFDGTSGSILSIVNHPKDLAQHA